MRKVLGHKGKKICKLELACFFRVYLFTPFGELLFSGCLIQRSHKQWQFLDFNALLTEISTKLSLSLSNSWNAYLNSAIFYSDSCFYITIIKLYIFLNHPIYQNLFLSLPIFSFFSPLLSFSFTSTELSMMMLLLPDFDPLLLGCCIMLTECFFRLFTTKVDI